MISGILGLLIGTGIVGVVSYIHFSNYFSKIADNMMEDLGKDMKDIL